MSEKFTYAENRDTPAGWAFIVSLKCVDPNFFKVTLKNAEISLKINGYDASFLNIIERMNENFQHAVNEAAKKIVEERLQRIDLLATGFTQKAIQLFPELYQDE